MDTGKFKKILKAISEATLVISESSDDLEKDREFAYKLVYKEIYEKIDSCGTKHKILVMCGDDCIMLGSPEWVGIDGNHVLVYLRRTKGILFPVPYPTWSSNKGNGKIPDYIAQWIVEVTDEFIESFNFEKLKENLQKLITERGRKVFNVMGCTDSYFKQKERKNDTL